jgi:hypothetical protein
VVERDTLALPQRYQRLSPNNDRDSYYAPRGGQALNLRYFGGQQGSDVPGPLHRS